MLLSVFAAGCKSTGSRVEPVDMTETEEANLVSACKDDKDAAACMKMGKAYARRDGIEARRAAREYYDAACTLGSRTGCLLREVANPVTSKMLSKLEDKVVQYQKYCLGGENDYCRYLAYYIYDSDAGADATLVMRRAMAVNCVKGYPRDCYWLAKALDRGYGGHERDPEAAFLISDWSCRKNAEPMSCHLVALAYDSGEVVLEDDARACELYIQSCDDGFFHGCGNAALSLENGYCEGGKQYDRSLEYAEKGCEEELGNGCRYKGVLYEHGLGVDESFEQALAFYHEGCEYDYGKACLDAGELLASKTVQRLYGEKSSTGMSVRDYFERAEKLLRDSCEKSLLGTACWTLAEFYEEHDVKRRSRYSVELLRRRACHLDIRMCDGGPEDELDDTL
jgi:TPR repeat protein